MYILQLILLFFQLIFKVLLFLQEDLNHIWQLINLFILIVKLLSFFPYHVINHFLFSIDLLLQSKDTFLFLLVLLHGGVNFLGGHPDLTNLRQFHSPVILKHLLILLRNPTANNAVLVLVIVDSPSASVLFVITDPHILSDFLFFLQILELLSFLLLLLLPFLLLYLPLQSLPNCLLLIFLFPVQDRLLVPPLNYVPPRLQFYINPVFQHLPSSHYRWKIHFGCVRLVLHTVHQPIISSILAFSKSFVTYNLYCRFLSEFMRFSW